MPQPAASKANATAWPVGTVVFVDLEHLQALVARHLDRDDFGPELAGRLRGTEARLRAPSSAVLLLAADAVLAHQVLGMLARPRPGSGIDFEEPPLVPMALRTGSARMMFKGRTAVVRSLR